MHKSLIIALLMLAACGKSETPSPAPATATPTPSAAVDVCALLSKDDAGAALGATISGAEPQTAQGSLLGGCKYLSDQGVIVLSARPARELDATVRSFTELAAIDGVGAKAYYADKFGLMLQPEGKPYFLHVMLVGGSGSKQERMVALAKKIVAK